MGEAGPVGQANGCAANPAPTTPAQLRLRRPTPIPAAPVPVEPALSHRPPRYHADTTAGDAATGMTIPVRVDESLSSDRNVAGDTFQASLAEPLVVDGLVIAEKGARVTGRIVDARRPGRLSGRPCWNWNSAPWPTSDGQRIAISTDPWTKQADSSRRRTCREESAAAPRWVRLSARLRVAAWARRLEPESAAERVRAPPWSRTENP